MIPSEALVTAVTAAAISISQGRSTDELNLLGAMFAQLGDTLSTIAAHRGIIEAKCDDYKNKNTSATSFNSPFNNSPNTQNNIKSDTKSEKNTIEKDKSDDNKL